MMIWDKPSEQTSVCGVQADEIVSQSPPPRDAQQHEAGLDMSGVLSSLQGESMVRGTFVVLGAEPGSCSLRNMSSSFFFSLKEGTFEISPSSSRANSWLQ